MRRELRVCAPRRLSFIGAIGEGQEWPERVIAPKRNGASLGRPIGFPVAATVVTMATITLATRPRFSHNGFPSNGLPGRSVSPGFIASMSGQ